MVEKGILKNLSKFKNVRFSNFLDLSNASSIKRENNTTGRLTGVSSQTFGKRWFLTPEGRAIFKTYDSEYANVIRDVRILNELIVQELCKQIDLPCVSYELAKLKDDYGLISYDITNNGKKLIDLYSFLSYDKNLRVNLYDLCEGIDVYKYNNYKINKREIVSNIYKEMILDTLTLQTDRNPGNINLLYEPKNKRYKFAPVFDNEFAFCGERVYEWYKFNYGELMDFQSIIHEHSNFSKIFTVDDEYIGNRKRFKHNVEMLVGYAKKYPTLGNILNETINKINIKDAIRKVESKGVKINSAYKEFMQNIVENVKEMFNMQLKQHISKAELNDMEKLY